jgi:hypothetical protein
MHRTIRRRPLFVGFTLFILSVRLNARQPSEARPSSSLVIATARPKAAVRFLPAFYTADYRKRKYWLGVPLNVG